MKFINYIMVHKEWIFSGIGVFALGLFILLFQQRQRAKDKAEQRVNAFVESFRKLYKGGGYKLEVLVPAGIAGLNNDREVRRAFELLVKVIPNHPLRNWKGRVEKVGYKKFFDYAVASGRELNKVSIEESLGHFENLDRKP
jgi:hypothetical protein